jgi:hypothetical protein
MLETSKDVLNIILAISVFGISFFVAWSFFYLMMILRNLFKAVQEFKERMDKIDEGIVAFRNKIESSSSYLLLLGEGVKKLVEIMKSREKRRVEEDEN